MNHMVFPVSIEGSKRFTKWELVAKLLPETV